MILTFIGTCLMLACACFICIISNKHYEKINIEYKEIISLLYTIKQKISTSSQKLSIIVSNVDSYPYLERTSFICDAKRVGIYQSFIDNSSKLSILDEDKMLLSKCFSELGKNMLTSEIENIGLCIESIEKNYEKILMEMPKKKKINNTVIICVALLCVILII